MMTTAIISVSILTILLMSQLVSLNQRNDQLNGRLTYDQVVFAATACGTHNGFIALENISSQHSIHESSFIVRCKDGTQLTE